MKIQYHTNEPKIFSVVRSLDCVGLKNLITQDPTIVNQSRLADGFTPLHSAVYTNSLAVVGALLTYGADPNAISYTDCTPLELALKTADTNPLIIKELIKKGGSFFNEDVEYYYQRRVEKYSEKMSIKDLTCGIITGESKVKEVQITLYKSVDSVNYSNPFLNESDVLIEEILTCSSLNKDKEKDKDTFFNVIEIENKNQTILEAAIVENLSGNYEELDYYN